MMNDEPSSGHVAGGASTRMAMSMMMGGPEMLDATSSLVAFVREGDVFVKQAGEYAWGSVEAPGTSRHVTSCRTLGCGHSAVQCSRVR